jgi:hypothetical protein
LHALRSYRRLIIVKRRVLDNTKLAGRGGHQASWARGLQNFWRSEKTAEALLFFPWA